MNDDILEHMVTHEEPATLHDFVTLCKRIDNNLAQLRAQKQRRTTTTTLRPPATTPKPTTPTDSLRPGGVAPMDTSAGAARTRLSEEERARRISNNLYLRCGGEGHYSRNCPLKNHRPRTAAVAVAATGEQGQEATVEIESGKE